MAPKAVAVDTLRVAAVLARGGTLADAAREQGVHESTLHNRRKSDPRVAEAWDQARAQAALDRGKAAPPVAPTVDVPEGRLRDLKRSELTKLLAENQLNPEDWTIDRATVNKWGQPGEESRQVKVQMRPRTWVDDLRPANVSVPLNLPKPNGSYRRATKVKPLMIVAHGDDHAPYNESPLHKAFLKFLAEKQPDVLVHLGDLLDFPTLSRHRDNPAHDASPVECIDAGGQLLVDRRAVLPDAKMVLIRGNHDDRIRTETLNRAERMYEIRPMRRSGEPEPRKALDLRELLRLDEIGCEMATDNVDGEYFHDRYQVGETLEFRHGFMTGKGAASGTVERLGRNVFFGHTHHKRDYHVRRSFFGQHAVMVGVEVGPMCMMDEKGAPYAPHTDWHAGFVVVFVHPGGRIDYSHARWVDGAIHWCGQSWRP